MKRVLTVNFWELDASFDPFIIGINIFFWFEFESHKLYQDRWRMALSFCFYDMQQFSFSIEEYEIEMVPLSKFVILELLVNDSFQTVFFFFLFFESLENIVV